MYCANEDCGDLLTQEDIDRGYEHCSEDCFQADRRGITTSIFEDLFDDPFAESDEDEEDD